MSGVIGHDQNHLVPFDGGGHSQRYASITTGGFDDGIAGLQTAARLGLHNHIKRWSIFHGTRWIIAFEFHQYCRAACIEAL
ncbi:Uncharacterised protein [Vibrio cholerae]|uniref:Uncharacterized protein n=1 Tax=Vibrio cholerae TaxID=666 RepID=A0A655XHM2_VIBCL|nr:Uncharacterised protein [Vibrio cholerae]